MIDSFFFRFLVFRFSSKKNKSQSKNESKNLTPTQGKEKKSKEKHTLANSCRGKEWRDNFFRPLFTRINQIRSRIDSGQYIHTYIYIYIVLFVLTIPLLLLLLYCYYYIGEDSTNYIIALLFEGKQ